MQPLISETPTECLCKKWICTQETPLVDGGVYSEYDCTRLTCKLLISHCYPAKMERASSYLYIHIINYWCGVWYQQNTHTRYYGGSVYHIPWKRYGSNIICFAIYLMFLFFYTRDITQHFRYHIRLCPYKVL